LRHIEDIRLVIWRPGASNLEEICSASTQIVTDELSSGGEAELRNALYMMMDACKTGRLPSPSTVTHFAIEVKESGFRFHFSSAVGPRSSVCFYHQSQLTEVAMRYVNVSDSLVYFQNLKMIPWAMVVRLVE